MESGKDTETNTPTKRRGGVVDKGRGGGGQDAGGGRDGKGESESEEGGCNTQADVVYWGVDSAKEGGRPQELVLAFVPVTCARPITFTAKK